MKKKEREREKKKRREIGVTLERILHAVQVQRSPTAPQGSSPRRERENRREASKAILSIDIDEKRITYLKYTREHVTRSPTVSWKVFFQTLSLFHSSSNDFILTSRWGTMEIARR